MKTKHVNRRNFIQLAAVTGGALGLGFSPLPAAASTAAAADETGPLLLTKPYLQAPAPDGMTVMWLTSRQTQSWVEFQEAGGPKRRAAHSQNGMFSVSDRIQRIRLNNLKPGTTYTYTVFSKEITDFQPYKITFGQTVQAGPFTFSTPAADKEAVSFLILNDIHDRPASFGQLLALNKDERYDFVFLNGDMFNHQIDERQLIDHLIAPCTDSFASSKPFLFIRGNHETRGRFSPNLGRYFENIDGGNYFAFDRGPVHFVCLDTGEDKEDTAPVYAGLADYDRYRAEQAAWLEQHMQSKAYRQARFRVVLMHIPHYHSGDWHGTMHCRQLFGPLFNKYKIDMLISGHTHRYGIHEPQEGHNFPIVIGGGPQDGRRTLIRFNAAGRKLAVQMIRDDGQVVGNYAINR
ncbi:metallophosphoesterase [Pedobacter yulinensis]|uniref:Metallophosphoesterase n=1 Tax=Pedobacter yulinensis TaxID=2126353 RepID=A0A2T3HQE7_9SPHI|nr:metallophosphoesterase family protein [Pedobacter yulinensis]PST84668.1 metallophosphoesterase [Pedobacter yulinensis]